MVVAQTQAFYLPLWVSRRRHGDTVPPGCEQLRSRWVGFVADMRNSYSPFLNLNLDDYDSERLRLKSVDMKADSNAWEFSLDSRRRCFGFAASCQPDSSPGKWAIAGPLYRFRAMASSSAICCFNVAVEVDSFNKIFREE